MTSSDASLVEVIVPEAIAEEIARNTNDLRFFVFGRDESGFMIIIARGPMRFDKQLFRTETICTSVDQAIRAVRKILLTIRSQMTAKGVDTSAMTDEFIERVYADLSVDHHPAGFRSAMTFDIPPRASRV